MRKLEILVLVGNLEKLKIVIDFGVDVVYFGGSKFNLRVFLNNLINEEMVEGIKYCYDRGKKVYVILNVFVRNYDLKGVGDYIKELYDLGIDVIIVVDFLLIFIVKEVVLNLELYLSI